MASLMRPTTLLRQTALASRSAAFARPAAVRAAAFQTSSRKSAILPAGPQVIQGGVNDPAPIPTPSAAHGSYHWAFERLVAAGLVPLTIAPFAAGSLNPTLDAIFCGTLLIHSHMGFQQVVIDYIPQKGWPKLRKGATWLLNLVTLMVGVGLYEFETNDVGITEGVKRVWTAKAGTE
ncbi:CybS-domain-containing protein [Emericellopsis atlantica]|uniref:Succinate dehydrogenase [ubiquinone] cytochrome b small subunit n=1 Tax=Emericellopsis atlantica TaxID=2614577 RepID=A0A9P8CQQ3_9HYPO|nr:CybS-domain-containing protein [Emericellopsis atlantica]KAG9255883.1 CybS-domain-containing protein [Emericellopsis atlantica]